MSNTGILAIVVIDSHANSTEVHVSELRPDGDDNPIPGSKAVLDNLASAVRYYNRIANPPRRLQYPDMAYTTLPDLASRAEYLAAQQRWRAEVAEYRGRPVECWEEAASRLWMARSVAVQTGDLRRTSDTYRYISDRYRDAVQHAEHGRLLQSQGIVDVRV